MSQEAISVLHSASDEQQPITSVPTSQSYKDKIDTLMAIKETMGSVEACAIGEKSGELALKYLTRVHEDTKLAPVDVYIAKHKIWADAQRDWETAKIEAEKNARDKFPNDDQAAEEEFEAWSQGHYRSYKYTIQSAYMDWVTNGDKYNVEYNLGVLEARGLDHGTNQTQKVT